MLSANRILRFPSVVRARILVPLIPERLASTSRNSDIPNARAVDSLFIIQIKEFHCRRFSKKDLFSKLAEIDARSFIPEVSIPPRILKRHGRSMVGFLWRNISPSIAVWYALRIQDRVDNRSIYKRICRHDEPRREHAYYSKDKCTSDWRISKLHSYGKILGSFCLLRKKIHKYAINNNINT